MRRVVGLGIALLLAAMVTTGARAVTAPAGYYTDQKVVYHNDGGGPDNLTYFRRLLTNLRNHVAALGKEHIEIRVVDHGDGIILFQAAMTDEKLAQAIDARKADGVRFLICQNTLDERKIDWRALYGVTEQDIVPSGVAELVRLQMMGFTYIHP
jgi:intracellular sulfur oxidation DsrE/DsrF family protein